jgi:type I restriction enzyme S subunit
MSEWKEIKLKEIVQYIVDNRGKNPPYVLKGFEVIETGCISGKIKFPNYSLVKKYVDQNTYDNWFRKGHPQKDDLLIITVGNGIGSVSIMQENRGVITQNLIALRFNQDANSNYYFYYLNQDSIQEFLQSLNIGSAQPSLKVPHLLNLEVPAPPLIEQTAIASVLSSLDNKIDLLHRQNATLEKMAETLFRQWFVEEAKEGWEEIRLGSIVEVINGVSYKSDDLNSSKTAMVTLKSFDRNGGFRMDGFKEYTGKFKEQHILKEGDLVVAHTDITQEAEVIGNPVMVIGNPKYEVLVFSMDLVKVISNDENYSNEFLYLLMKSREFKEHCLGYSNGSTVLHLSKKAIPEYEMKLPPNKLINDFSFKVKPLVQKQFRNQTQIRTLTALRDTLLPKLMSGEVRVDL